ncbi:MAG: MBL fold metallo-hydrolase [Candidatus Pelethousia sp.]|nr:MBL fold metallo-hydrolase [Candidatus Pelethousia sp.]
MSIAIETMHTGPLRVNTYIVSGGLPGECFIVDPADANRHVLPYLNEKGLRCTAVLLTHCHFDHILGVAELQRQGAKVYIGKADAAGLYDETYNLQHVGIYPVEPCRADVTLEGGEEITPAGISLQVIATPGHSPGGLCYVCEEAKTIFSGDTLFCENVGRCDLFGGSAQQLYDSVRDRLFSLEGDYKVLPGHEAATTLEYERKYNPYLQRSPELW